MEHPFLSNNSDDLNNYLRVLFNNKNTIRMAHEKVCELIRNNRMPGDPVVRLGVPPPADANPHAPLNAQPSVDSCPLSFETVESDISRTVEHYKWRSNTDYTVEHYRNQKNDLIKILKIKDAFKKMSLELLGTFQNSTTADLDEISEIMFHRRTSKRCFIKASSFKFQLYKVKFIIGSDKIRIEVWNSAHASAVFNYIRSTSEDTLARYGDHEFFLFQKYEDVAVREFRFLIKRLSNEHVLEEVAFEIEPFLSYRAFLDTKVLNRIGKWLRKRKTKVQAKIFTYRFTRQLPNRKYKSPFFKIFKSLKPETLERLNFQMWNDDRVEGLKVLFIDFSDKLCKTKQWKSARHLNISDSLFSKQWKKFSHFQSISLLSLNAKDVEEIKETFTNQNYLPTQGCDIYVEPESPYNFTKIFRTLSPNDKFTNPMNPSMLVFPIDNQKEVTMEFEHNVIKVRVEERRQ
ncbi:hypothetical protein B9Z55_012735 [Caenorhabditis nigoni]|uniref:DUF38 domain-containing protein n=1 Tax=Caenorhabditis nigoni TaxID=1611254 RepID=A0A2G5TYL3_9PELO|nr:hypothetical protein B9Z55_012735 [Caenorhabditis nigoni]